MFAARPAAKKYHNQGFRMGSDITLMPLQKLLKDDRRASEHRAFLKHTGLVVPVGDEQDYGYTEQIGPYAVFHHLWRYAAYLEIKNEPPPEPGTHPLDDPVYQQAVATRKTRFEHLLRHSEEYGYYYPVDFADPLDIVVQQDSGFLKKFLGGSKDENKPVSFGSAIQLHKELLAINEFLRVPIRDEVPSQTYADGIHGDPWGDEKWTWVVLFFMSRKAIEHGQIMVFE
jgi:hypothetical protein